MPSKVSQWLSLDGLVVPTLASLAPSTNYRCRRWPSEKMVVKAKRPQVVSGALTTQSMVAKAKPPKVAPDRSGPRWDRQAVKAVAAAIRLLDRKDPKRLQRIADQRVQRRRERQRRVSEAIVSALAPPVTPKPSEADLAARKAQALAAAAALVAQMRSPRPI